MISLALIILAAIANSIMDVLKFRFKRSVFNSPGTRLFKYSEPYSWKRKWKNGDSSQGEAYLFSSTVLVWTTDLWHLAQMAMEMFFIAAIVTYKPIVHWGIDFDLFQIPLGVFIDRITDLTIYLVTRDLIFELFFSKILITWKK